MKTRIFCSALIACAALQAGAVSARSNYIPRTERGRLAEAIVLRWSVEGAKAHGTTPEGWAKAMAGALGHAPIEKLRKAASATRLRDAITSLQLGTFAVGQGSIFHTLTACRILDTHALQKVPADGIVAYIGIATANGYTDYTFQGGDASDCGIPATATALALQVSAIEADNRGTLSVFPNVGGGLPPGPSLIYPGYSQATAPVIVDVTGQETGIGVYSTASVHIAMHVVGYFAPAAVTQSCVSSAKSFVTVTDGSPGMFVNAPACPGGSNRVSVRCLVNNKQVTLLGTDDDDRCWFADTTTNGVAGSGTAVSKCCSVGVN